MQGQEGETDGGAQQDAGQAGQRAREELARWHAGKAVNRSILLAVNQAAEYATDDVRHHGAKDHAEDLGTGCDDPWRARCRIRQRLREAPGQP